LGRDFYSSALGRGDFLSPGPKRITGYLTIVVPTTLTNNEPAAASPV